MNAIGTGPRRHGREIFRIIGDRLGPYSLSRLPSAVRQPVDPDPEGMASEASELIQLSIEAWNRRRLETLGIGEVGTDPMRERRLSRLLDDVEELLSPVHKAVEIELTEQLTRLRIRSFKLGKE